MSLNLENVDLRDTFQSIFTSNSIPFSLIFDGENIDREVLQGLFSIISSEAFDFADGKLKGIIKGSNVSACRRLEDSNFYQEIAEDTDESFDYKLQDQKHSRANCISFIESKKEHLTDEQSLEASALLEAISFQNERYLSNIVFSYLMSALMFQMGINDGRRQTKLQWLPSSSEEADPFHGLNYGKEVTLKSALKSGLGVSYGCKCGTKFSKLHEENLILLKQLISAIKVPESSFFSTSKESSDQKQEGGSNVLIGIVLIGLAIIVATLA